MSFRIPIFATLMLAALGCGAVDPTGGLPAGDAQLAILNALPTGTVAELSIDEQTLPVPGSGTRISRVIPAGSHRLVARGASGHTISSIELITPVGGRRTVILGGSVNGGGVMLVAADTASIPTAGTAKLRVINTVVAASQLEAKVSRADLPVDPNADLLSPFPYGTTIEGELPDFLTRSPGSFVVSVRDLATGTLQASTIVPVAAGEIWSVVLIRLVDGELKLVPIRES